MPKVNFVKENICIEVGKNTILLDAIRKTKLSIETPCNGMGFCGKCKIIAKGQLSEPNDREKKIIDEEKCERLSCMAEILGDVEVELIEKQKVLKTIDKGFSIDVEIDSPVKLVRLPEINQSSSIPYVDYIGYRISSVDLHRKIAVIEEGIFKEIWGVVLEHRLLDISTYKKDVLGLAVDIGTTGVSYYLVDLSNGQVVRSLSSLNPQTQYGGDVLTRITYCMEDPSGAVKLQKLIVDEINNKIKRLVDSVYSVDDIYHIAIAANTTMMHLLLGINPESLAKAPYRSVFLSCEDIKAKDISIKANNEALLTIIPSASSYVGGDIVSGIMASGFQNNKKAVFIDIGTNGELAALKDGKIICTSTAAGPALEGMNIECGCRAEEGAIEKFDIDEDCNITYSTIGNAKAIGICGSGLIDIAGALVKRDIIMKSGRWNKDTNPKLAARLVDKKFYITDDIYISQKDIRQIQLAKGAIASGVIMMLDEIGLTIEEIPLVYIAGAFGYHINPDNIMEIGLIPKGFNGDIKFLGNTSLEGARLALINNNCHNKVYKIKENMKVLELSLKENFQDIFVAQLNF
ncbi:ASKHA domain-containing protein [Schnuerera sp. xch1]|uniref:ASKHA domain-containing protein n=1 Tax=Schnuerera sp. xch1 TaxID=2874283 RepID=UPI001CC17771|nr:ASKHA domain-containing protein [Schnuerera sp. xch1]MBZ2174709.1 ASKHA domain-containing protein [Schnuerera sp. xch1]